MPNKSRLSFVTRHILLLATLFALFSVSEYHSLKTSYLIGGASVGLELSRYFAALGAVLIVNAIGARLFSLKLTALSPYFAGGLATVTAGTITSFFTVALWIDRPVLALSDWVNLSWDFFKIFCVHVVLATPIVILVLLMASLRSRLSQGDAMADRVTWAEDLKQGFRALMKAALIIELLVAAYGVDILIGASERHPQLEERIYWIVGLSLVFQFTGWAWIFKSRQKAKGV